jgi:ABC-type Na+ efflux pump permease subunit
MNFWKKINFKTILFHSLFWVAVWFFFFYFFSYNSDKVDYALWFSSGLLPLTIGVTYFVNYRLIPRYLLAKRYWKFALYSFYFIRYLFAYLYLPDFGA